MDDNDRPKTRRKQNKDEVIRSEPSNEISFTFPEQDFEPYTITDEQKTRHPFVTEARVRNEIFKDFHLSPVLGRGAESVVYRSRLAEAGKYKTVAVKIYIREEDETYEGLFDRWIKEVLVLEHFSTDMTHPNVIRMLSAFRTPDNVYVVFPVYLFSLYDVIYRKIPDIMRCNSLINIDQISTIKRIAMGITSGLQCIHSHKVMHRDIKPENIMFDKHFNPVIIDFGMAYDDNLVNESEKMMKMPVVCTVTYRSIEVSMGMRHYTHKVDIWALGCVFSEMVERARLIQLSIEHRSMTHLFNEYVRVLGPVDEKTPGLCDLDNFQKVIAWQKRCEGQFSDKNLLKNRHSNTVYNGLLTDMLSYDTSKRPECALILQRLDLIN